MSDYEIKMGEVQDVEQTPSQIVADELSRIQKELKAPKGQFNSFGKYKYRSCEDIIEAVKKTMKPGFYVMLTDEIVSIGNRVYVKATARLGYGEKIFYTTAYAREPDSKKGMDDSQVTGTASSYARKYALNGLFAIDDTKDADTMDNRTSDIDKYKKYINDYVKKNGADATREIIGPSSELKTLADWKDAYEALLIETTSQSIAIQN